MKIKNDTTEIVAEIHLLRIFPMSTPTPTNSIAKRKPVRVELPILDSGTTAPLMMVPVNNALSAKRQTKAWPVVRKRPANKAVTARRTSVFSEASIS